MGASRDHNTLVRVLKRIVMDADAREEWREVLGEAFYHAAVEFLADHQAVGEGDLGSQFADYVDNHHAIVVPVAVAEAVRALTGSYGPQDGRHPDNQDKVAITVPKNVAAAFQV
jgi:hypothetical protein